MSARRGLDERLIGTIALAAIGVVSLFLFALRGPAEPASAIRAAIGAGIYALPLLAIALIVSAFPRRTADAGPRLLVAALALLIAGAAAAAGNRNAALGAAGAGIFELLIAARRINRGVLLGVDPGRDPLGLHIAALWVAHAGASAEWIASARFAGILVLVHGVADAVGDGLSRLIAWYREAMRSALPEQRPPVVGEDEETTDEPEDEGPMEAAAGEAYPRNLTDEQLRICTGIIAFAAENFRRDGWDTPRISRVIVAPAYTTYVIRTPSTFPSAKFISRAVDMAGALEIDKDDLTVESGSRYGILIQIRNETRGVVWYDDLLRKHEQVVAEKPYAAVVGEDSFGEPVVVDIDDEVPHLIVAGKSGSGKSAINHIVLTQLLRKNSPDRFQLAFIDLKKVTAPIYRNVPHLWHEAAVVEKEVPNLLTSVREEMERRERLIADAAVTKFQAYNAAHPSDPIPVLLIVIDEAASISDMAQEKSTTEAYHREVGLIATRGRSAGVFLLFGVQRPSQNNIGENIRPNLGQRIALAANQANESGLVIGDPKDDSAIRLTGKGDGYHVIGGRKRRFTGAYIPENIGEAKARPDYYIGVVIDEIIEKWEGRVRTVRSSGPTEAKASAVDARVAVAGRHKPSISDFDWLVIEAIDALTAKDPDPYVPHDVTGAALLPLMLTVAGDYPFDRPPLASDVARSLGRLIGAPVPGADKWVIFRTHVTGSAYDAGLRGTHGTSSTASATGPDGAPVADGPSVEEILTRRSVGD